VTPLYPLVSVRKRYGAKVALDVEELTISPGRVHILMGPNGSGKSTLLSVLAFLMKPDAGQVIFAGDPVRWKRAELKRLRQSVTLLHQSPYLFAGTVFSNLAFGLKIRGAKGEALRRSAEDALMLVGLAGFEGRQVRTLSGGEARRVALARALALQPAVLLLDEPLANVDKDSAEVIELLIASLARQGTTIVMSTHELPQGDRLPGELICLADGKVVDSTIREEPREEMRARSAASSVAR
jgi:tungstate transport system ATP-binding protein